jgi:hypothetical protein
LGKIRVLSSGRIGISTRNPLCAKALVLEELCVPLEMFDSYRERLKREAGIDYGVLKASHRHNTPETNPETAEHTAKKSCGCRGERGAVRVLSPTLTPLLSRAIPFTSSST